MERKQGIFDALQVLNWANRDGDPLASNMFQIYSFPSRLATRCVSYACIYLLTMLEIRSLQGR